MRENEAAAHELVRAFAAIGVAASVSGGGVHWKVETAARSSRSLLVHCFWYERALSGLLLGMNPANARSKLRRTVEPREGAEYLVIARQAGAQVADGRTGQASAVVSCARAWLSGVGLEALTHAAPFIDQQRRTTRAIAERLDPGLRWDIGEDPGYELWIYGNNRSCKVSATDGTVDCALFVGQAQIGYVPHVADVPAVSSHWLLHGVSVRDLAARIPSVELERHAEVVEADPARWHWLNVHDRLQNPQDVLGPLRNLIEALAARPIPTRFFSYSSLNRFCFSSSSHFPWVDRGLPVIAPTRNGGYAVNDTPSDLARAIEVIEAQLATYPIAPFFGSAPHHELPLLSDALARHGSRLRPALEQRGAWFRLVVASGPRRCEIDDRSVVFQDGTRHRRVAYDTLDHAVGEIRAYLGGSVSLDELSDQG